MNNSLNLITKKSLIFFLKSGKQRPGSWNRRDKVIRFFLFCTSSLPLNFDSLFLFFILAHYLFDNISRTIFFLFGHTSILSIKIEFAPSGTAFTLSSSQPIRRSWRRNCAISRKWYPPAFCNHPIHCERRGEGLGCLMIWPGVQRWKSRMKEKLSRQSKENAERKRKEFGIKCIHLWPDLKLNPFPPRCTFSLAAFHSLSKRKLLKLLINDTPLSVCRAWVHLVYLRWI